MPSRTPAMPRRPSTAHKISLPAVVAVQIQVTPTVAVGTKKGIALVGMGTSEAWLGLPAASECEGVKTRLNGQNCGTAACLPRIFAAKLLTAMAAWVLMEQSECRLCAAAGDDLAPFLLWNNSENEALGFSALVDSKDAI